MVQRDSKDVKHRMAAGPPSGQNLVFVSYCHADSRWLERLRIHLKPLERHGVITLWDDTRIRPGTPWREEIRRALEHARVAVLLITADFLASDFIATNELPPLLESAERKGTLILPLIVKPCRFQQTEGLARFQAINDPAQPLVALRSARREQMFVKISGIIEEALQMAAERHSPVQQATSIIGRLDNETVRVVQFAHYTIRELKSGTIEVECDGQQVTPVKPVLRKLASSLGVGLFNRNGNPLNTRQLGSLIIGRIEQGTPENASIAEKNIPSEARTVSAEVERILPEMLQELEKRKQQDRDAHARGQGFTSYAEMVRRMRR